MGLERQQLDLVAAYLLLAPKIRHQFLLQAARRFLHPLSNLGVTLKVPETLAVLVAIAQGISLIATLEFFFKTPGVPTAISVADERAKAFGLELVGSDLQNDGRQDYNTECSHDYFKVSDY